MIAFCRIGCLLFGILAYTDIAVAQSFYVSPHGNDNFPGTKARPLASLTGARDRIRQWRTSHPESNKSMIVLIAGGNYWMKSRLQLAAEDGGTSAHPVIYKAVHGQHPVFCGGVAIHKFKLYQPGLWRADVKNVPDFEQLYVNERRAARAGTAVTAFLKPKSVTETIIVRGSGQRADEAEQKIKIGAAPFRLLDKLDSGGLSQAVLTFYHKWDITRKKLWKFERTDSTLTIRGQGMKPWNRIDTNSLFTVENISEGLDEPGEWFLSKEKQLFYKPVSGEKNDRVIAVAPVLSRFIDIQGSSERQVSNIKFENLTFKYAGYQMPEQGIEPQQAEASIDACIMLNYASGIQFRDCEISHTGTNAIWFRTACTNSELKHCLLHDLGAGGVKIGEVNLSSAPVTEGITVDNCIIQNGGRVFPSAVAVIIFNSANNRVTHNDIADFYYSGVSAGWVWGYSSSVAKNNNISYNHIHHLGWGLLSDMGGVYTLGPSEGTVVGHNMIDHVYAYAYGGWGLYTDEGSTGIRMEDNLVYACKSGAFHQHYGKDNLLQNNIFVNQLHFQLEATKTEQHLSFAFRHNIIYYTRGELAGIHWDKPSFLADSNCYWNTQHQPITVQSTSFSQWQERGQDIHSIIADPLLKNTARDVFIPTDNAVLKAIGFKPFHPEEAGVYGTVAWRRRAEVAVALRAAFDQRVDEWEKKNIKDF